MNTNIPIKFHLFTKGVWGWGGLIMPEKKKFTKFKLCFKKPTKENLVKWAKYLHGTNMQAKFYLST